MGRIKGYYEWDDDHLTPGQKKEGGLHQNLFDSGGNLKGSARFVPDEGSEGKPFLVTETVYVPVEERRSTQDDEEFAQAITVLVLHFLKWGVVKAKPYAEQRWRKSTKPVIDAQKAKFVERRLRRSAKREIAAANATLIEPSRELTEMSSDGRPDMSRAEAQARLLAALAAQVYSDEQMRLVGSANMVDGEDFAEIKRSLAQLPANQVKGLIEAMATKPSMLGEDTLAEIASLLGRQAL
ncbi:hypothetical protein [Kineococcus rubinsiae]|uniref:hypothetical protein n=1 Tax=Kineococcus rubinsiae TaxID=2609562 RepID=UPI0014310622|nr:hypothetical protein [Kineococcus rubinsiae]NIZ93498.1 hypothetical protein [Kineococcus rubinsiae]